MAVLHYHDEEFVAEKVVQTGNKIILYDAQNNIIHKIVNIKGSKWKDFELDGEWTPIKEIPTSEDYLRADIDFLTMENEALSEDIEQSKADIDYLLMLIDE